MKNPLDQLLFKPFIFNGKIIVIYDSNTSVTQTIGLNGKIHKKTVLSLGVYDVSTSLSLQTPVVENIVIPNVPEFLKNLKPVNPTTDLIQIAESSQVLVEQLSHLEDLSNNCKSILCAINQVGREYKENASEIQDNKDILFASDNAPIAHIIFKAIDGIKDKIQEKDIIRIGEVLINTLREKANIDSSNQDDLRKLKAELEYKILEALPNTFTAQDIRINMDEILHQIKTMNEPNDDENDNMENT